VSDAAFDRHRALAVGANLAADAVAAEVVPELERRGIRTLVLRGPAIARWLYREGERDYDDVDLLVEPGAIARAEETLRILGFHGRALVESFNHGRPRHAEMWVRSAAPPVDLHRTIVGAAASDREVWRSFWRHAEPITLQDAEIKSLDRTALLVVLTLHAAQHGLEAATRDLRVAIERVSIETWEQASRLADELGAVPAFEAGLRMFGAGGEIADRLQIATQPTPEILLRTQAAPDLSLGLNWVADLPSARARACFIVSKVFPEPDSLRDVSAVARRGPMGLAIAYAQRIAWLTIRAPRAISATRRARRSASGREPR
jgi:hypothetical protein